MEGKITPAMLLAYDEQGQLVIQGPLKNKVLSYGLLVSAILAVYEHKDIEEAIIVPPAGLALVP